MRKHAAARGSRSRTSTYKALCVALSVLIPPLGLILTWRSRWSSNAKYCLTGLAVISFALIVVLAPNPDVRVAGGVRMVGREKEAEVYGPELPTAIISGYVAPLGDSVFAETTENPSEDELVYAMPGAKFYHLSTCRYAYDSAQKLTVYEAHFMGYAPCTECNPPAYVPETM